MRPLLLASVAFAFGISMTSCAKDDDASSTNAFMDMGDADMSGGGTAADADADASGTSGASASADGGADVPSDDGESSSSASTEGGNPGCGDGMITSPEQCDGNDLDGYTCETLGYTGGGQLACDPVTCTLDTSNCIPGSGGTNSTSGM
jgi:hypothetical protein